VLELKKRLEDYGFQLITAESEDAREERSTPGLEVAERVPLEVDRQLSFELERPKPRLRALRRHPSI
jgi:hypothetical protein